VCAPGSAVLEPDFHLARPEAELLRQRQLLLLFATERAGVKTKAGRGKMFDQSLESRTGLSVACSLKLSSRNADCSFERRSFLRDEPPSSSSLAREHARSAAAAWPRADEPVRKEPALLLGDDDTAASSSPAAPPVHDGARFTSTPRVGASKCPADHTRTHTGSSAVSRHDPTQKAKSNKPNALLTGVGR
jgi:hypothetical protein